MTLYIGLVLLCIIGIGLFRLGRRRFGQPPAAARGSLATYHYDAKRPEATAADGNEKFARPSHAAGGTVPHADTPPRAHPAPDAANAMPRPDLSVRVLHVVVADDNAAAQQHAAALLEAAGHRVTLVADGRKAVEAVRNGNYDIVLVAVQMAVMDGVQAANHIRALASPKCDIPIVGLDSDMARGAQEHHRRAGMDACLRTPLCIEAMGVIHGLTAVGRPPRLLADGVPALDRSAVDMLREFLTPEQLDALLAASLIDIELRIKRLSAFLNLKDAASTAKEAHDLVSIAGNCGASALSALARDIQRACKQDRLADATQAFARMPGAAAEAYEAVSGLRRVLASTGSVLKDGMTAHLNSG